MIRRVGIVLGLCLALSMSGREARAQWGYGNGGWGWGGWGAETAESAGLKGAGFYAMGAGMYNLNTAQATSINAQTAMQWNDYVATVTQESARMHAMRVHSEFKNNQRQYDAWKNRLRTNPGKVEIEDGSALNIALDDLTNPRLGSSALRAARAPVPAKLIADVPFVNNAERATLMLDQMRQAVKWPEVFEDKKYDKDRQLFDEIRAKIRADIGDKGEVSAKTLRAAQQHIDDMLGRITAHPLPDPLDQKEAMKFLTTCQHLLNMLKKPDLAPAMLALRDVKDTTVGNLLGFMHSFNLRFGRATTLKEKQAYSQLFEAIDQTRDQILAELKGDRTTTAQANPAPAAEFFQNVNQGRGGRRTPQPPPARNPQ
jgi:hypothetical protein